MKTIADFKRRISVGIKLQSERYIKKSTGWVLTTEPNYTREVTIAASKHFALKTFNKIKNEWVDSYVDYPKKDEFNVMDENTIKIEDNLCKLIYKFI